MKSKVDSPGPDVFPVSSWRHSSPYMNPPLCSQRPGQKSMSLLLKFPGLFDWWSVCCTVSPAPADERVPLSSRTCSCHLTPESYFSFGVSVPGLSSRAGGEAKMSPVAPPAPTQHKVVVGGGAHGIKHVGFIWDLELWGGERKRRGEEVWQFVFREPTLASAVVITVIS